MTTPLINPTFVADFSNQEGWFDPDSFTETVTIIGLGGIGGTLIPLISTLGFRKYVLWEDDVVKPHNMATTTTFLPEHLLQPKAEVCRDRLYAGGATDVKIIPRKFTANDDVEGIVISAVDNMTARQEIWQAVKRSNVQFYLDGRIGGLQFSLFGVEPFDGEWYEQRWLFDDSQAAPLPCATRAIAFTAEALSAYIGAFLVNWHRGEMPPKRVDVDLGSFFFQAVGRRS